jgi:hypothetical protein
MEGFGAAADHQNRAATPVFPAADDAHSEVADVAIRQTARPAVTIPEMMVSGIDEQVPGLQLFQQIAEQTATRVRPADHDGAEVAEQAHELRHAGRDMDENSGGFLLQNFDVCRVGVVGYDAQTLPGHGAGQCAAAWVKPDNSNLKLVW